LKESELAKKSASPSPNSSLFPEERPSKKALSRIQAEDVNPVLDWIKNSGAR
jgi:hypothetical protein